MQQVLEWAEFTPKPGVSDEALKSAAQSLQAGFLSQQPGYLRRELVRLSAQTYADMIWWRSAAEAEAAMQRASESPACAAYFGMMALDPDNPAEAVRHYDVVASYGG